MALDHPVRVVANALCRDKNAAHSVDDNWILQQWSMREEEGRALIQASLDSPYADPQDRRDLLEAAGLKEIPVEDRPAVSRKEYFTCLH